MTPNRKALAPPAYNIRSQGRNHHSVNLRHIGNEVEFPLPSYPPCNLQWSDIIELSIKGFPLFYSKMFLSPRVLPSNIPTFFENRLQTAQNEIRIPGTSAKDGTQVRSHLQTQGMWLFSQGSITPKLVLALNK